MKMDICTNLQDVLRCHLCDSPLPELYCEPCNINLCKACVGDHLLDESKQHTVLPIKQKWSPSHENLKCSKHPSKVYDLYCEDCDTPICAKCVSSGEHELHEKIDIFEGFENKKIFLQGCLEELKNLIYPNYHKAACNIEDQKRELKKNSKKIRRTLEDRGNFWREQICTITQYLQSQINEIESTCLGFLDREEKEINFNITEISKQIHYLHYLLETNDVCLVSEYKSRNAEFMMIRKDSDMIQLPLPDFLPKEFNIDDVNRLFGSLSLTPEECTRMCESSTSDRSMLDFPQVITSVDIEFRELYNVALQNDDQMWTSGLDAIIKLYNLEGELLNSVQTRTGNEPLDIALTHSGDLVYSDYEDNSIGIVCNTKREYTGIKTHPWKPGNVCISSSGDLLVVLHSSNNTKVVRFSKTNASFTNKQEIQCDENDKPLYSPGNLKYLRENRNLNICVADRNAGAVVVVSAAGKFRFKYNGNPSKKKRFKPVGIVTDNQGKILIADYYNHCVHILNEDGLFLRFIDNLDLKPWCLSIDSNDNLFVAEKKKSKVTKIQYYK